MAHSNLVDLSNIETILVETKQQMQSGRVVTLTHTFTNAVHTLTGSLGSDRLVKAIFTATADFTEGDTFTINDVPYTAQTVRGDILATDTFVSGASCDVTIDTVNHTLSFNVGGEVGWCSLWEGKEYLIAGIAIFDEVKSLCSARDSGFQMTTSDGMHFLAASQNGTSFITVSGNSKAKVVNLEGDNAFTTEANGFQIASNSQYFFILRKISSTTAKQAPVDDRTHRLHWYDLNGTYVGGDYSVNHANPGSPMIFADSSGVIWYPETAYDADGTAIECATGFNVNDLSNLKRTYLGVGENMCGANPTGVFSYKTDETDASVTIKFTYHDGTTPSVTATVEAPPNPGWGVSSVTVYPRTYLDDEHVLLAITYYSYKIKYALFSVNDGLVELLDRTAYIIASEGEYAIVLKSDRVGAFQYQVYRNLRLVRELKSLMSPPELPLVGAIVRRGNVFAIPNKETFLVGRSVKVR